jgi:UDP-GlcNAc3NAcA epimerase
MKKRIITIAGARPQFIKAATLSRAFKEESRIEEHFIHTGQHSDANMSGIFFQELNISKPKYELGIHGGSHAQMTGLMLEAIENILMQEKPDAALVYGDTNSTLAGALAASKLSIPVIHVESGLRSFNRKMPEEINRVITDHLSSLLLCPTQASIENLKKEGITKGVYHVGDVMYDAVLYAKEFCKKQKVLDKKLEFLPENFALMTVHRAESVQSIDTFQKIISFALQFSFEHQLKLVFPVHPRTKKIINFLSEEQSKRMVLIDPLSYFETQFCLSKAQYVLTDSGGLQKEAYFHRVPCITLRSETEWVETLENGWNRLWETDDYNQRKDILDYGGGYTAEKILEIILQFLK